MRSHENSPYAWTDGMMGAKKDTLTIIDKRSLEVVRSMTPEPGKTAAHVEFDKDGRYAWCRSGKTRALWWSMTRRRLPRSSGFRCRGRQASTTYGTRSTSPTGPAIDERRARANGAADRRAWRRQPNASNESVQRIARALAKRGLVGEVAVGFINGRPAIGEASACWLPAGSSSIRCLPPAAISPATGWSTD